MSAPSSSSPGLPTLTDRQLADGKYAVGERIGRGAMGEVYEAVHTALDRRVAIKVLNPTMMQQPDAAERFRREALAASRIHHPHSMAILDFGQEDELFYIVMEYLEGASLGEVLKQERVLSEPRIVHLMSQALGALARAHDEGIIHRDLKPDNIVVTRTISDDGHAIESAKVCDFGIAKISDPGGELETLTNVGAVAGTPHYMSPEQGRGQKLDLRSDLYACGVILYRMATGRVPFVGDNALSVIYKHISDRPEAPRQVRPEISERMEAVILKALYKEPDDRYATAREMRNALRATLAGADGGQDFTFANTDPSLLSGAETLYQSDIVPRAEVAAAALAAEATQPDFSEDGTDDDIPVVGQPPTATEPATAAAAESRGDPAVKAPPPARRRVGLALFLALLLGGAALAAWPSLSGRAPTEDPARTGQTAAEAAAAMARLGPRASEGQPRPAREVGAEDGGAQTAQEIEAPKAEEIEAPKAEEIEAPKAEEIEAPKAEEIEAPKAARRPRRVVRRRPAAPVADDTPETTIAALMPAKAEAGAPVADTPKPAPPAPTAPVPVPAAAPAVTPPRYDAKARLVDMRQSGSLSAKAIRLALKGLTDDADACYTPAATAAAWHRTVTVVSVKMDIDEDGRGTRVKVSGGPPGLSDCIAAAARRVRSRQRPDTGIVELKFKLRFRL